MSTVDGVWEHNMDGMIVIAYRRPAPEDRSHPQLIGVNDDLWWMKIDGDQLWRLVRNLAD